MDFKLGLMGIPGFMQQEVSDSQTPDADRNAVTNKTSSPSRSAGSNKQCSRPSLELDSSDDFRVPATKMARTESFSSKHSTPGHVTPCSPSDSTSAASDEAASIRSVLTSPTDSSGAHSHSQQRMMMMHHYQQQQRNCNADASAVNIALPPPPQFLNNPFLKQQQQQQQQMMIQIAQQQQQQQQQQQYHHHQPETFQFKQAADMGLHEAVFGPRYPFTSTQWAELEHQALVFKCMMARAPIPPELVAPILKSVAASNMCLQHHQNGWSQTSAATHHLDVEPGRCRRTDGKKWRCARPIVPDQKYCERHMHRGRNRKRGTAATTTSSTTTAAATTPSPMMLAAQKQQQQQQQQQHSLLQMNQRTTALQNHVLPQHQHHQQQQQQQQHQHQHQHFGRGYGTINTSGHMVVTAPSSSSSASSSMFHTAASYAGAGAGSLDSRITAFDLRPEQLLVSGRGQGEPASTKEDFPYARFFLHSDAEEEANFLQQQQQQQYLDLATATAYKKPDANASLRQLFVEGAGDGAASTLTSWSDQSSTHLSISMAGGSEFPNALQSHSHSLKLSMNNNNCSSSKQQWRGQLAESFQSSSSSNKGLGFETNTKSPLHKPTLGCFSEISSSSSAANSGVKPDNLLLS